MFLGYAFSIDYRDRRGHAYMLADQETTERLNKPLLRVGFPVFDRVGNAHKVSVGYRGTMNLIFEISNLMIERIAHHHAGDWPLTPEAQLATRRLDGNQALPPSTELAAASA